MHRMERLRRMERLHESLRKEQEWEGRTMTSALDMEVEAEMAFEGFLEETRGVFKKEGQEI